MSNKSFLYLSCLKLNDNSAEKLSSLPMDMLLLDLEDSVPLEEKNEARNILEKQFGSLQKKISKIAIRINSLKSSEGLKDLNFICERKMDFSVILLSMVEDQFEVFLAKKVLNEANIQSDICVLIETPIAIKNVDEIACVSDGLFYGGADYCSLLGTNITKDNILIDYVSSKIVNAAMIYSIPAYDTPCFRLKDLDYLEKECLKGFKQGFAGKQAIHPEQLDVINKCFQYSSKSIKWASEVIKSSNAQGGRISKSANLMVGPPFVKLAKKILESSQY